MNVNTFYGCDENYDPKPTAQNNLFSHLENPQLQTWWALKEAIGMDLENTTPVQKTELWDIYNNDGIAYGDALSYLHALDETDEYPLLVMPEDKSLYVNPFNDKEERSYKISLTVSPNPANDVIRITYPLEADGLGFIEVYDAKGNLVLNTKLNDFGIKELSVKDWSKGLYLLKLSVDGLKVGDGKFSVIH